jgi:hypothetical protein
MVCSALVPVIAAFVISRDTRLLRDWASHPWIVFWLCSPSSLFIGIPVDLLTRDDYSLPRPVALSLVTVAFVPPLVLMAAVSASIGVRRTWLKSRSRATFLVLAVAFIIVLISGPPPPGVSQDQALLRLFTPSVVATGWWILMAIATEYLARRLVVRKRGRLKAKKIRRTAVKPR